MAEKRDYYEVLGVAKTASADEIKQAYRKAAMKWHPDRWVEGSEAEKKTAEENFKEASEAYSVLSDPDKKAKYDQFGFAGVDGQAGPDFSGGFGNLNDILNDLFGGGFSFGGFNFGGSSSQRSSSQERVVRGRDIRTRVRLTLEEIARGVEKEVTIERNRPCPDCGGKGAKNASDIRTCPQCKGAGYIQQYASTLFGRTMTQTVCPQCQGEGKVITNPCRSCGGTGLVRKRETVKVKIPAGVEDNMQLTLRGEGHSGSHNGINGDLLVLINEVEHPNLKRDGKNLFYTTTISMPDAILGTEVNIPGIDGTYKLKIDPGTQSGAVVKMRGKGLPAVSGYGIGNGDLYVKVLVWLPKRLTREEKEALEKMRSSGTFTPDPTRDDRIVFDKIKNIF